ncbi:hypothetical protein GCM10008024_14500 [Allgaiera indica]|uniref:Uncharacterized protein n=1 Tax=Allgaiera indica TaxID=765699 RepID=A0AAN4UQG3_9RHOB|nr:hypothetical protein GCM10008024_14500 [Allgaiera indica]
MNHAASPAALFNIKRDIPGFPVAQDQQARSRHTLGQHLAAQGGGKQRLQQRVQRGEDGFSDGWHLRAL